MVGESKILTVSYGTFSCTLEGFDDSFSTMKAIAEYFKGLAADDRYFGAEPPVPDADMLMRIAEREVHSRVEAQIGDSGITLRKSDAEEAEAPAIAPAEAPVEAPKEPVAKIAPAPQPTPEVEVAATPVAPAFTPAPETGDVESVAAKLQRIRAVVSRAPTDAPQEIIEDANTEDLLAPIESAFRDVLPEQEDAPEAAVVVEEVEEVSTPEAAPVAEEPSELPVEAQPETSEIVEETVEAAVEDVQEDAVDIEETVKEETSTLVEEEAQPEEADEASILAGVGAFMSQSDDSATEEDTVEEYSNEQGDTPIEATDISSILGAISAQDADESAPEEIQPEEDVAESDDEETLEASSEISEGIETTEPSEEDLADLARLDEVAEVEVEAEETVEVEVSEDLVETPNDEEPTRVAKGGISNVAARARARVISVKKADMEEALENDSVSELLDDAQADETPNTDDVAITTDDAPKVEENAEESASLSAEDEADLMAELAAAEQDAVDIPDLEPLPEVTEYRSLSKEADEENVARLMEESDTKFAETESTRRRSAIAHLKAAVAATVADRKILGGSKPKDEDATDEYRKDLADVVRPNRAKRILGKKEDRPAPLVLVSEQRIDLHDGPAIRPRRIRNTAPELRDVNQDLSEVESLDPKKAKHLAESKSFAEFAERVGATELPDLLEAAAAYASFVEGKEHFTRPEVMRRVLRFGEDQGLTREEGLRSFGLLLRQGKIEKVKRGQFKVAESTQFNPQTRIAGE